MKSTNDKIEREIDSILNWQVGLVIKAFMDKQITGKEIHLTDEMLLNDLAKAKSRLKQLIKETLQECIGENEPEEEFTKSGVNLAVVKGNTVRNQLRKEALTKLEEKLNQLSQQTLDK